jgi:hypothetical protein
MNDRRGQFDMAHALAPYFGLNDFDTAFLADHAAMAHAFILATVALVILGRTKDLSAKQTIAFRLEGPVVDGLRLFYFAMGPRANFFRRSDGNFDRVKTERIFRFFK